MKKIFDGIVDLYAQGENALTDGKKQSNSNLYTKFNIGACSDLVLEDQRKMSWSDLDSFAIPSKAQIFYDDKNEKIRIVLLKPEKEPRSTVYFGVIYNNEFPAVPIEWEVFKDSPLSKNAIAFVALLPEPLSSLVSES